MARPVPDFTKTMPDELNPTPTTEWPAPVARRIQVRAHESTRVRRGLLPVEHRVVCRLNVLDDHTQFFTVNLSQSRDSAGQHASYIGKMRIGGSRQDVVRGAQNHLDGLRSIGEVPGVSVSSPPNLDSLKPRESQRNMVKSLGAPGEFDFRHTSIMRVRRAAKRVKVSESEEYMSSRGV